MFFEIVLFNVRTFFVVFLLFEKKNEKDKKILLFK